MEKRLEAVFEHGVLRPLAPLGLPENAHVLLSIGPVVVPTPNVSRQAEIQWLEAHGTEYAGQWVALDGDRLLSFGEDGLAVHAEARETGVGRPLLVHLPDKAEIAAARGPLAVMIRLDGKIIRRIEVAVGSQPPVWLGPSLQAMERLMALPANWDLDGAPPIYLSFAQAALDGLSKFMDAATAAPQWTPTRSGGLQVDWHESGIDLEIAFEAEHPSGYAVFSDHSDAAAEWEGDVDANLDKLRSVAENRLHGQYRR